MAQSHFVQDGRRLAAVRTSDLAAAELKLIVAAGGKPEQLAQESREAANVSLTRLGFSKAAVRVKLLQALTTFRAADVSAGAPSAAAESAAKLAGNASVPEKVEEAPSSLADVLRIGLIHRRSDAFSLALVDRSCSSAMAELCPRRGFLQKRYYTSWLAVSASPARMLWALECGMSHHDLRNGVTSWSAWQRIEGLRADATATMSTRALLRREVSAR